MALTIHARNSPTGMQYEIVTSITNHEARKYKLGGKQAGFHLYTHLLS